jgi:membrane-associated protease RseP (regulator of RpoE activity)
MRRHLHSAVLTLTLLSVVAVAAGAQDSLRLRTRSPDRTLVYSFGPEDLRIDMRRGRLGITVDLRPDAARDSVGARVSGVTPGGPADHAGVQTGDIITRLNGTRLAAETRSGGEDDEQSRPGMRLINLASRLDAGDTVRLDVRRDGRPLTLTFVADRTDMDQLVERMRIPGNGQMLLGRLGPMGPFGDGLPGAGEMHVFVNGNMGDLEMVKVSPQLAEGLGITEGLLVVAIDSSSSLGLRAGDVITGIGGRRPASPSQAMRILSTYEAGETVSFDVMRQRRRTTVSGRMPENRRSEWRVRPNNFEFSLPRRLSEPMMRGFERELQPFIEMMRERPMQRLIGPDWPAKSLMRFEGKV